MVEIKCLLKYHREAPRKIRLVASLIKKNTNVVEAKNQLKFSPKKAAETLISVLNSAIANAKHNYNLEEEDLKIKEIIVNEGPKLKRWRPVAMSSAHPIEKKTSHITVVIEGNLQKKGKIKLGQKTKTKQKEEEGMHVSPQKEKKPEKVKEKAEQKKKTPFWQRQKERILRKEAPKRRFFQRKSI